MEANKEQVQQFLPHRDPFLFIDEVEYMEDQKGSRDITQKVKVYKDLVGSKIKAHFNLRPDLEILRGHFPGKPILPGVVQIEMMAQAACFIMLKVMDDPYGGELDVALLSATNTKFRKPALPGMSLEINVELVRARGNILSYKGSIQANGEILSEAEFLASVNYTEKQ